MTEAICDNCGKLFLCHNWRLRERVNVFCCRKCSGEYVKSHNPNWIPCEVCGRITYKKPGEQSKTKHMCCSMECLGRLRTTIYQGDNNPNYGNRGSSNPIWKSDERISTYGYRLIRKPDHPFCNTDKYVFEHRLVAEEFLLNDENSITIGGVNYLNPKYVVHHVDENRLNNNQDNLQVMPRATHTSLHISKKSQH